MLKSISTKIDLNVEASLFLLLLFVFQKRNYHKMCVFLCQIWAETFWV